MTLDRWDPFREGLSLRSAMDRLLEESVIRPSSGLLRGATVALPLDIAETEDALVITASLPGIKPEAVDISVQGSTLTLRGQTMAAADQPGTRWHVRERPVGAFHRSVTLPTPVNANACDAQYEYGVLTLTLPKADETRLKRIPVGAAQPQRQQGHA